MEEDDYAPLPVPRTALRIFIPSFTHPCRVHHPPVIAASCLTPMWDAACLCCPQSRRWQVKLGIIMGVDLLAAH